MNSDTPRTDKVEHIGEFGANRFELAKFARQLERELTAANAKLQKLDRLIEIAQKANDAQSEQEVASSATFAEALAYTESEMIEAQLTAAQERIAELEKDKQHIYFILGLTAKERDQLKQQLVAMELVVGVKDEALKLIEPSTNDVFFLKDFDAWQCKYCLVEVKGLISNIQHKPECKWFRRHQALSTEPSELYRKVVEVISQLIAACPHEAEGQQRAMAALKGRELLQLLNAGKETK